MYNGHNLGRGTNERERMKEEREGGREREMGPYEDSSRS
jgi:hypothetical protein